MRVFKAIMLIGIAFIYPIMFILSKLRGMEAIVKKINEQCITIAKEMDEVMRELNGNVVGLTNTLSMMEAQYDANHAVIEE